MKYAFIKEHRGSWAVSLMTGVLAVSVSGFYDWLRRGQSKRAKEDETLSEKIVMSHCGELGPRGPGFARSRAALPTVRRASTRTYELPDTTSGASVWPV